MKEERSQVTGAADTDYYYFFCPNCGDDEILRLLDCRVLLDGPVEYTRELRPKAKKEFINSYERYCPKCQFHDVIKLSNVGLQGGRLKDSPAFW